MVCTIRVYYDVRIIIVICSVIDRILLRVYVIFPASVITVIIIDFGVIIFSRKVFLIGLFIVCIRVGDFILQSVKNL